MSKVVNGDTVSVHYRGTLNDGTEFDNSYLRGEPISFTVGGGQMISGFDSAAVGMTIGETKTVRLTPDQAYGDRIDDAIRPFSKGDFPDGFNFEVGQEVHGQNASGFPLVATITEVRDEDVTLDMNHPMAGKELNFQIELVDIKEDQEG